MPSALDIIWFKHYICNLANAWCDHNFCIALRVLIIVGECGRVTLRSWLVLMTSLSWLIHTALRCALS